MRFVRILSPMLLALLAGNSTAHAVDRPHYDATYDAAATNLGALDIRAPKRRVSTSKLGGQSRTAAALPLVVTSSNVRRDAPVGVTDPSVAARFYLDKLAAAYDLSDSVSRS